MKHILSADQFSKQDLEKILTRAADMENILQKGGSKIAEGKILATLFYEASTRTRLSFETAMYRLGGNIISEADVQFSSQTKGEVLADTIRIVGGYADIIAIRSPNIGDAKLAAQYSPVPILNGGDGPAEHPTQALLDLYTIKKNFSKLGTQKLTVSFVGDLKYGRTVHSLIKLLRHFEGISINFVAPESIQIPEKYIQPNDTLINTLNSDILKNSDIIYDTRIQRERFEDLQDFLNVKDAFIFTPQLVNQMKASAILMHPLPRINEITLEVDTLPQAKYFEQAQNGVPIRMALIAESLGL